MKQRPTPTFTALTLNLHMELWGCPQMWLWVCFVSNYVSTYQYPNVKKKPKLFPFSYCALFCRSQYAVELVQYLNLRFIFLAHI